MLFSCISFLSFLHLLLLWNVFNKHMSHVWFVSLANIFQWSIWVHFKVLWWLFWMDCPSLMLHMALHLTALVELDIRLMSKTSIQTSSFQKPFLPRTQEDNGVSDFIYIVIEQFELMENMSKTLQHPLLKEFYLSFSLPPLFFMNDGHHS